VKATAVADHRNEARIATSSPTWEASITGPGYTVREPGTFRMPEEVVAMFLGLHDPLPPEVPGAGFRAPMHNNRTRV
jgi:hypothetical protein